MRLIDADALLEKMKGTPRYFDVKFDIEEQPTAYDVEKVVEQIHGYFCKVIDACEEDIIPHEILEYNKAICEIVRSVGVE